MHHLTNEQFCDTIFAIGGANIHEAQYAQGTKDFISKFEIALKEASEMGYWLDLLYMTKYIDEQAFKALSSKMHFFESYADCIL